MPACLQNTWAKKAATDVFDNMRLTRAEPDRKMSAEHAGIRDLGTHQADKTGPPECYKEAKSDAGRIA